jgi:hypothetical protein
MTVHNAASQSGVLLTTRPAETGQPGQAHGRSFWKEFLMALMRALSAWVV